MNGLSVAVIHLLWVLGVEIEGFELWGEVVLVLVLSVLYNTLLLNA